MTRVQQLEEALEDIQERCSRLRRSRINRSPNEINEFLEEIEILAETAVHMPVGVEEEA